MSENYKELFVSFEQKLNILSDDFDCLKKVAKSMIEKVEDEKNRNENMIKQYKKYEVVESDIIKLNVGGTLFSTLKSTLTKQIKNEEGELYQPNMFDGLLNGFVKPKYDENKAIFIDRNPKYFSSILDYMRMANTDSEFEVPANVDENELRKEAKFYNIQGLVEITELSFTMMSTIINKKQVNDLMKLCEFDNKSKWNLLYRASTHGYRAQNFHTYCNNQRNTLTIIKSNYGYIFGGFTTQAWDSSNTFKTDPEAFLFSLVNGKQRHLKIKIMDANGQNAIYCHQSYGPTFGSGHDFHIIDNSNVSNSSYSNFGSGYKCENITNGTIEAQSLLAGAYNFTVSEIEVFQKT